MQTQTEKFEESYHSTRTTLYDVLDGEAVRTSGVRFTGPQCQHLEIGRCRRCENPMNPRLNNTSLAWDHVQHFDGRKLYNSINQKNGHSTDVEAKFRKLVNSLKRNNNEYHVSRSRQEVRNQH